MWGNVGNVGNVGPLHGHPAIDILKIKELSHVRWLLMPLSGESFVKSTAVKTLILNAYSSISSHYYLIYQQRGEM